MPNTKKKLRPKIRLTISIFILLFSLVFFLSESILLGVLTILLAIPFSPFLYKPIEKLRKKDFKRYHKSGSFIVFFILFFIALVATSSSLEQQTNQDMQILYKEITTRSQMDQKLSKYAKKENIKFRDEYDNSQKQGEIVLEKIYDIISDLEKQKQLANINIFSSNVYAKKRRSMRYYVPIVGSLVKAKHQSLETARANLYEAISDPKYPEGKEILTYYGIKDVEELRTLDDKLLEKVIRDPELHGHIDFAKITKDLGETAVNTVIEASQTVIGGEIINPISATKDNFIEDLKDGELDTVGEELKSKNKGILQIKQKPATSKKTKTTIVGVQKSTIQKLPPQIIEKKWNKIPPKQQEKVSKNIISDKDKPLLFIHKSDLPDTSLKLDIGNREISATDEKKGLLDFGELQIDPGLTTQIDNTKETIKVKEKLTLKESFTEEKINSKETNIETEQPTISVEIENNENTDTNDEDEQYEEENIYPEIDDDLFTIVDGEKIYTPEPGRIYYYNSCDACKSMGLDCRKTEVLEDYYCIKTKEINEEIIFEKANNDDLPDLSNVFENTYVQTPNGIKQRKDVTEADYEAQETNNYNTNEDNGRHTDPDEIADILFGD